MRLVQTLYLPPATGTMRMPAVRMFGGFKPSGLVVSTSALAAFEAALSLGVNSPATVITSLSVTLIITEMAPVARRSRRFIIPQDSSMFNKCEHAVTTPPSAADTEHVIRVRGTQ